MEFTMELGEVEYKPGEKSGPSTCIPIGTHSDFNEDGERGEREDSYLDGVWETGHRGTGSGGRDGEADRNGNGNHPQGWGIDTGNRHGLVRNGSGMGCFGGGGSGGGRTPEGAADGKQQQFSRSLAPPSAMNQHFEHHIRKALCEGYLERQSKQSDAVWRRRWFLLKDNTLSYFHDKEEAEAFKGGARESLHNPSSSHVIALDQVEAVRTVEDFGPTAFRVISASREDLVLRADSKEEMQDWLFGFLQVLAGIVASLVKDPSHNTLEHSSMRSGKRSFLYSPQRDERARKQVLGHGHGRENRRKLGFYSSMVKTDGPIFRKHLSGSELLPAFARSASGQLRIGRTDFGPMRGPSPAKESDMSMAKNMLREGHNNKGGGGAVQSRRHTSASASAATDQAKLAQMDWLNRERDTDVDETDAFPLSDGGAEGGGELDTTAATTALERDSDEDEEDEPMQMVITSVVSSDLDDEALAAPGGGAFSSSAAAAISPRSFSHSSRSHSHSHSSRFHSHSHSSRSHSRSHSRSRSRPRRSAAAPGGGGLDATLTVGGLTVGDDDASLGSVGGGSTSSSSSGEEDPPLDATLAATVSLASPADADRDGLGVGCEPSPHEGALSAALRMPPPAMLPPSRSPPPPIRSISDPTHWGPGSQSPHHHGVVSAVSSVAAAAAGSSGGGDGATAVLRAATATAAAVAAPPKKYVPPHLRGRGVSEPVAIAAAPARRSQLGEDEEEVEENMFGFSPEEIVYQGGGAGSNQLGGGREAGTGVGAVGCGASPPPPPQWITGGGGGGGGGGGVVGSPPPGAEEMLAIGGGVYERRDSLPWAEAVSEFHYDGSYHDDMPCLPNSDCNEGKGGRRGRRRRRQSGEGAAVGNTAAQQAQAQSSSGGGGPHLSWSSGVCSIMGRREKQEDRYIVIPRFEEMHGRRRQQQQQWRRQEEEEEEEEEEGVEHQASGEATCGEDQRRRGRDGGETGGEEEADDGDKDEDEEGTKEAFFGVYDGHCGYRAAQFVRDKLHVQAGAHEHFLSDPRRAFHEVIEKVDAEFLELCAENQWYSGTTVLVALLRGSMLLLGCLGDCEAVLSRDGGAKCVSVKHNPNREDEKSRITAANGWVTEEKELFLRQLKQMDLQDPLIRQSATEHVKWTTITRLCGEISVSRAVGDRDFKGFTQRRLDMEHEEAGRRRLAATGGHGQGQGQGQEQGQERDNGGVGGVGGLLRGQEGDQHDEQNEQQEEQKQQRQQQQEEEAPLRKGVPPLEAGLFLWPKEHSGEFFDDLIIPTPEFTEEQLRPGDDFLVLACDGLWDVLSMEEVVQHGQQCSRKGLCAQATASSLCKLAYKTGTSDNVTVVVVRLHWA